MPAATVGSEAGDALGASMLLEPAAELTLVEAEEAEAGEEAALEDAAAGSTSWSERGAGDEASFVFCRCCGLGARSC